MEEIVGSRSGTETERRVAAILWLVLCFDGCVTLVEGVGAFESGSLALWVNFLTGLYDALLIYLNIWGLGHECNGRPEKGRQIARVSDALLAVGFGIMIFVAIIRLSEVTLQGASHPVDGELVILIAGIAAFVNFASSRLCPQGLLNSESARLKLCAGAAIAAATIANGFALMVWSCDWIDPAMTIAIGICVFYAAIRRIAHTTERH